MSQQLEIHIKAVDDASKTVVEASKTVASSMKSVEDANKRVVEVNRQVSESSRDVAASLSDSERVQLSNVVSSQQLETAEKRVTETKRILNVAVREHGVASEEATRALRDYNAAQSEAANLSRQLGSQIQATTRSTKDLVVGFSGVATSAFSLYSAVDRVGDAQLRLDRANLQVKTSSKGVETAQVRLNDAIQKYGANSAQAIAAAQDLEIAQERYSVAADNADNVQDNLNSTMIQGALQIIPTSITMVDSLSRTWKNFPDMSGMLKNLSSNVANVGSTAKTAAIGVGAFIGGFMVGEALLNAVPEELQAIAGALMASIAAIVAATVAWMAFHGTMTIGVAVPVILAAVGAGIAGVKAAVGMKEGGIITQPTYALIGEAGPEAVVPLKGAARGLDFAEISEAVNRVVEVKAAVSMAKGSIIREPTFALIGEAGPEAVIPLSKMGYGGFEGTQYITVNPTISIGNISGDVDLERATGAVSRGIAEGLRRRLP